MLASPLALGVALLWQRGPLHAQVMQPTGEVMPQPTGQPEIDVVTSRGFMPDAVTLEGLFMYRGEAIDTVADAHMVPGAFSPLCGFTGELVLRGGDCQVAFGWYNVNPDGSPPAMIYELIPPNPQDADGLACQDNGFCPLATMETTQPGQHTWTPKVYSADNIRTDARYLGGLVGFALIGGPGLCQQTKYSEAGLNQASPMGAPWVTTLIYRSTATPDAFYVNFEDLPTNAQTWKGGPGSQNDGDFNDFVFFVTGLTCDGGGEPCATGLLGVCSGGLTDCAADGTATTCRQTLQPSDEACDNLDNDCDGELDEGDFCPEGQVCVRGRCVGACGTADVVCSSTQACDAEGHCVEPSCLNMACTAGQVCRGGSCVDGCAGVVCPLGEVCQLGACINLCAGVTCEEGKVCEQGVCVQRCQCRPACPGTTVCAESGQCVDPGCEALSCGAGQVCVAGACADPCQNAVCPNGELCQAGSCAEGGAEPAGGASGTGGASTGSGGLGLIAAPAPSALGGSSSNGGAASGQGGNTAAGGSTGSGTGGGSVVGGSSGTPAAGGAPGTSGAGGTTAAPPGANGGAAASTTGPRDPSKEDTGGCGCRLGQDREQTPRLALVAMLAAWLAARRRKS